MEENKPNDYSSNLSISHGYPPGACILSKGMQRFLSRRSANSVSFRSPEELADSVEERLEEVLRWAAGLDAGIATAREQLIPIFMEYVLGESESKGSGKTKNQVARLVFMIFGDYRESKCEITRVEALTERYPALTKEIVFCCSRMIVELTRRVEHRDKEISKRRRRHLDSWLHDPGNTQ
jgi:hypothetical protein